METNNRIQEWYMECMVALIEDFGDVRYDYPGFRWVLIQTFPLPSTFSQTASSLLIKTPGYSIDNADAYKFYVDIGLQRQDKSLHLFENRDYNDLYKKGYARLSFHLKSFRPAFPVYQGDTFIDICVSVYTFLGTKW